mgnify:CR=1 FL=1
MTEALVHTTTRIDNVSVKVVDADITELEVDAIVNPSNTNMVAGKGQTVSGAIARKTGRRVAEELAEVDRPVRIGEVVHTSGGGLPCRHIFHVAAHAPAAVERQMVKEMGIDPDTLRLRAVTQGLTASITGAKAHQCRSLAVPLIGSGTLALPVDLSVEIILNTLRAELKKEPGSLRNVFVVIKGNPAHRTFVERADERQLELRFSDN